MKQTLKTADVEFTIVEQLADALFASISRTDGRLNDYWRSAGMLDLAKALGFDGEVLTGKAWAIADLKLQQKVAQNLAEREG